MSDSNTTPNPKLLESVGTCYFGAGQKADPNFIPCGNANLNGPQACCYKGDYCLAGNACWDAVTYVSYIAGCTDPQFRASTCPQRNNYPDQQWVAIARCDGDEKRYWTGCDHHPNLIEIEKENCSCNRSNTLIENPDGNIPTLLEIGLLPNKTGDRIEFNPTAIPSAEPTNDGNGGLSTGAKAGMGVGIAIAGLLLIAGVVFLIFRRRRRSGQAPPPYSDQPEVSEKRLEMGEGRGRTASDKSELSPEAALSEMPSNGTGSKFQELESPDEQPKEMDGQNGYHSYVNTPAVAYAPNRDVSPIDSDRSPSTRNVSSDRPSFVSPFSDERPELPKPASVKTDRTSSAGQLPGSRKFSQASPAAERKPAPKPRADSIPMAGGFEIGERSRASQRGRRERQSNAQARDEDLIEEAYD